MGYFLVLYIYFGSIVLGRHSIGDINDPFIYYRKESLGGHILQIVAIC